MKKLYLEGTQRLTLEDNKVVQLDYYLVEDHKVLGQQVLLYGIKIVKHLESYLEMEYSDPISCSKEVVKEMVHKLCCNGVTLVSMLEVVDDMVSESFN